MTELEGLKNHKNPDRVGDVIFIHGMHGDRRSTWQRANQPDTFWPDWLGRELPHVGFWTLGYEASTTDWIRGALPLPDFATFLLNHLREHELKGPLVFVTHSMGGLVAKMLLQQADILNEPQLKAVVADTRGVVFIATPHVGAPLANWLRRLTWHVRSLLRLSPILDGLVAGNPELRNLHIWYRKHAPERGIRTIAYRETSKVGKWVPIIVPEIYSDPGTESAVVPIPESNHVSIAKPESDNAHLYLQTRRLIREWLGDKAPPSVKGAWLRPFDSKTVERHREDTEGLATELDRRSQWSSLRETLESQRPAVLLVHGGERQRLGSFLDRVRQKVNAGIKVRAHRVLDVLFGEPVRCLTGSDWQSALNLAMDGLSHKQTPLDRIAHLANQQPLLFILGRHPLSNLGDKELEGLKEFLGTTLPELLQRLPDAVRWPVHILLTLYDHDETDPTVDRLRKAALAGADRNPKILVPQVERIVLPDADEAIREVRDMLQSKGQPLSEEQAEAIRQATDKIRADPQADFYDLAEFITCYLAEGTP